MSEPSQLPVSQGSRLQSCDAVSRRHLWRAARRTTPGARSGSRGWVHRRRDYGGLIFHRPARPIWPDADRPSTRRRLQRRPKSPIGFEMSSFWRSAGRLPADSPAPRTRSWRPETWRFQGRFGRDPERGPDARPSTSTSRTLRSRKSLRLSTAISTFGAAPMLDRLLLRSELVRAIREAHYRARLRRGRDADPAQVHAGRRSRLHRPQPPAARLGPTPCRRARSNSSSC